MKHTLSRITALLLCLLSPCAVLHAAKPNILLILADDMGFSDLGCYGGEIANQTGSLGR